MSKYDYEYVWDSYYCYPGTSVLINRLDIQDSDLLSEAERRVTALNILEIKENPVCGKFDLKHLCDIHNAIFGDVFAWAGKLRTVNIAKGNQFCLFQHIEAYAANVFSELKAEEYLINKSADEMPERLTYYLSEINVLHPFRDGNGRAQRIFIEYLAQYAGFYVDFSFITGEEMIEVSALSFAKEYDLMTDMFKKILSPITPQEQQLFRSKIGTGKTKR